MKLLRKLRDKPYIMKDGLIVFDITRVHFMDTSTGSRESIILQ